MADEGFPIRHSSIDHSHMKLTLKIWRQSGPNDKGKIVDYPVNDVSEDMSF